MYVMKSFRVILFIRHGFFTLQFIRGMFIKKNLSFSKFAIFSFKYCKLNMVQMQLQVFYAYIFLSIFTI